MNNYETVLILPPTTTAQQADQIVEKHSQFLEKKGGQMITVDKWGVRRGAYQIGRYRELYYVILQFKATPEVIPALDQSLRLDTAIIRYLSIKLDTKALEKHRAAAARKKEEKTHDESEITRAK